VDKPAKNVDNLYSDSIISTD